MSLALSTCVLLISLMQLVNGAQSLNATSVTLSSAYFSLNKNICTTVIT